MKAYLSISGSALALALMAAPAAAQNAASVTIADSSEYGQYLADAEGRALYLFTTDTQGMGDMEPQISCSGECLDHWPLFTAQGDPQAGANVDISLLGTTEHEGEMVVTYNGWPLYYFAADQGPGETQGQGRGDVWYLISPAGEQIE